MLYIVSFWIRRVWMVHVRLWIIARDSSEDSLGLFLFWWTNPGRWSSMFFSIMFCGRSTTKTLRIKMHQEAVYLDPTRKLQEAAADVQALLVRANWTSGVETNLLVRESCTIYIYIYIFVGLVYPSVCRYKPCDRDICLFASTSHQRCRLGKFHWLDSSLVMFVGLEVLLAKSKLFPTRLTTRLWSFSPLCDSILNDQAPTASEMSRAQGSSKLGVSCELIRTEVLSLWIYFWGLLLRKQPQKQLRLKRRHDFVTQILALNLWSLQVWGRFLEPKTLRVWFWNSTTEEAQSDAREFWRQDLKGRSVAG